MPFVGTIKLQFVGKVVGVDQIDEPLFDTTVGRRDVDER